MRVVCTFLTTDRWLFWHIHDHIVECDVLHWGRHKQQLINTSTTEQLCIEYNFSPVSKFQFISPGSRPPRAASPKYNNKYLKTQFYGWELAWYLPAYHIVQTKAAMARVTRSQQDRIQSSEAHRYYSLDKVKLLFIPIQGGLEKQE